MLRKRTTIRPTKQGWLFLFILVACLAGASNYNNNPGFIFTFLLGAMLLVSIFHTWKNLSGVQIISVRVNPVFMNERVVFQLRVRSTHSPKIALEFRFDTGDPVRKNLIDGTDHTVETGIVTTRRGLFNPGPLTVSTRYPLGLIQCSYEQNLNVECLVYPQPMDNLYQHVENYYHSDIENKQDQNVVDDFEGFKAYQPGDPLRHISWKAFARGQGLLVREFDEQASTAVLIDWYSISEADVEKKLSFMCDHLLKVKKQNISYGLRLPGTIIEPGRDEQHHHKCLKVLALYGMAGDSL